jgi:cytochrome c553
MKGRFFAAGLSLLMALPAAVQAADLKRAEEIVGGRCFLCHGMEGEAASALYPRLAGQHAEYIAKQLSDFKTGKRKSDTMSGMVGDLSPEEMKALGAFFEQKKPSHNSRSRCRSGRWGATSSPRATSTRASPPARPATAPRVTARRNLPRLAGQQPLYLENQLKQFNTRERNNDNAVMHSIASKLTELEVKAVSSYISTLD